MKLLVLMLAVVAASAEVIDIRYCDGVDLNKCVINEIKVDPCPDKRACKLVKGNDAHITLDFTPNFSTSNLKTLVTYNGIPWSDLDSDACKATSCPTVAGTKQIYNTQMHIGSKLPSGKFTFNWSVYDENDATNKCCFQATVKLVKK